MSNYIDPAHVDDLVRITGQRDMYKAHNTRLVAMLKDANTALEGTYSAVVTNNQYWLDTYAPQYLSGVIDRARVLLAVLEETP